MMLQRFHLLALKDGAGRIAVIGSVQMFTNEYFGKEDNTKIFV
jgi:hypothetical protein